MRFVGQLRLEDLNIDWGGPRSGVLSFFVAADADGCPLWEPGAGAVVHESLLGAIPRKHPETSATNPVTKPMALTFAPELCLPSSASGPNLALRAIGLDLDDLAEAERYMALCNEVAAAQGLLTPATAGPAA
jgi:hypothetical protein